MQVKIKGFNANAKIIMEDKEKVSNMIVSIYSSKLPKVSDFKNKIIEELREHDLEIDKDYHIYKIERDLTSFNVMFEICEEKTDGTLVLSPAEEIVIEEGVDNE